MNNLKITDVRHLNGDSAFLADDGKTSILYDTGFGFTGYEVAKNIKKVLGKRNLDYIFLTHSHYDHALGSAYILRHYKDAKVVAGEYAASVFQRDGAKKVMKELDGKYARKCNVGDYEFLGDELKVDICVRDGDVLKAGDMEFEVLALPGHTKCSVGFYLKKEKILFSSETLGVYDGEENIVPSFLVSFKDTLKSIEKVKGKEIRQILAPHFGLLDEERTKYFLENMKSANEECARDIFESIKKGESDEQIMENIKTKYIHGKIKETYPDDASNLNISIMTELIRKELC